MNLGLFGGSFDPIHRGHVEPVLAAVDALELDRVLYLPTARPPHKRDQSFAPPLSRYAMVELALLDHDRLRVSDFEMTPGAFAYTIDTISHFREEAGDRRLFYIIGSDSFGDLPHWRRGAELVESVELIVISRPGWVLDEVLSRLSPEEREVMERARVHCIENVPVDVSSTELRRALREHRDRDLEDMLDSRVLRYIRKYGLYCSVDD